MILELPHAAESPDSLDYVVSLDRPSLSWILGLHKGRLAYSAFRLRIQAPSMTKQNIYILITGAINNHHFPALQKRSPPFE